MNSLVSTARKRARRNAQTLSLASFHQLDEDVLQPGDACVQRHPGCSPEGGDGCSSSAASVPLTCSTLPNGATWLDARQSAQLRGQRVNIGALHQPGGDAGIFTTSADRALGQQLAIGDVGEPVAALRLVHVVGGDQHRDALRRRAGGSRPRNRAAPWGPRRRWARRAAAAAARAACRRPAPAAASSRPTACRPAASGGRPGRAAPALSSTASFAVVHAVHAGDEIQVLADGQVFVEAEALRHVADLALDLAAFRGYVVAQAGAAARRRA